MRFPEQAGEGAMVTILITLSVIGGVGLAAGTCIYAKQALFDSALDDTRGYF